MLASYLIGKLLLHIPCWLHFYVGSFCYTSHAGFIFVWEVSLTHPVLFVVVLLGVSLTHPVLASFLSGEFILDKPCWLHFYLARPPPPPPPPPLRVSLTHPVLASFFISGVSLTHPVLVLCIFSGSFSDTCRAGFSFIRGGSLIHPVLASFFFFFLWEVSLTHPVLAFFNYFLSREFL